MPYFGGGMNFAEAHQPLILERNGLKIAILGYNNVELRSYKAGPDTPGLAWIELDQLAADVRAAREQADIVVVYPHWGYDYAFGTRRTRPRSPGWPSTTAPTWWWARTRTSPSRWKFTTTG